MSPWDQGQQIFGLRISPELVMGGENNQDGV